MDKYEYKVRSDEIKELIANGDFVQAAEIADTIDWRRVKSVMMLCTVSDLYKINRRYEDARDMLLLAYERRPGGRTICYSLCELSIKTEEFVQAVEYYKEFVQVAPKDPGRYILQYKLYEAQEVSLEERIEVLEELKKRDYREKWAYELAYLYHRVGLGTRCVEECDELILWFGDGKYVVKAMELKMLHQPLTPEQQDKYEHRFGVPEDYQNQEPGENYQDSQGMDGNGGSQGYEIIQEAPVYQDARDRGAIQEPPVYHEVQGFDIGGVTKEYKAVQAEAPAPVQERVHEKVQNSKQDELDIQVKPLDMGQYNTLNLQAELAAGLKEVLGDDRKSTMDNPITRSILAPMMEQDTQPPEAYPDAHPMEGTGEEEAESALEKVESTEVFFGETGELEAVEQPPQEEESEAFVDTVAETVMQELRQESQAGRNEEEPASQAAEQTNPPHSLIVQPPKELANVLAQESDGQISLVMPESRSVEKQITGQMNIEEILVEWERLKRENVEKGKEEIRRHVLAQTGDMFTEFEAAIRDGLLEKLESEKETLLDIDILVDDAEKEQTSEEEIPEYDVIDVLPGEAVRQIPEALPEEEKGTEEIAGEDPEYDVIEVLPEKGAVKFTEEFQEYGAAGEQPAEPAEEAFTEQSAEPVEEAFAEQSAESAEEAFAGRPAEPAEEAFTERPVEPEEPAGAMAEASGELPEYDVIEALPEKAAAKLPKEFPKYGAAGEQSAEPAEETFIEQPAEPAEEAFTEQPAEPAEEAFTGQPAGSAEEAFTGQPAGPAEEAFIEQSAEPIEETFIEETFIEQPVEPAKEAFTEQPEEPIESRGQESKKLSGYDVTGELPGEAAAKLPEEEPEEEEPDEEPEETLGGPPNYKKILEEVSEEERLKYEQIRGKTLQVISEYENMTEEELARFGRNAESARKDAFQEESSKEPSGAGHPEAKEPETAAKSTAQPSVERDKAKVRSLTREEKEIFAPFIQSRSAREQLVNVLDNISMAAYTGNVIITGEEGTDILNLAKNVVREVKQTDSNFSGKVAKISGQALNNKNVADTVRQLASGALIIQDASGMTEETAEALYQSLQQENLGVIVVLEDTRHAMDKFLARSGQLKNSFTNRMDVEALSNDLLVSYGRQYAKELEYSIDDLGMLALHTRIEEQQTMEHAVTVMEVKEMVDEAIRHVNRKTLGHFMDVLFAKRYDEEDMIILGEKDFN